MKVALVLDNNIEFAPYIYSYCEILKKKYEKIDVIIWNRKAIKYINSSKEVFNVISISNNSETKNKFKLAINKYNFAKKAKKYILKNNYDRTIIFNEDIYLMFGNIKGLILDNRDLKLIKENKYIISKIFKNKIKKIESVIHASDAFKEYYEREYKYFNNYIFYNMPRELEKYLSNENIEKNINYEKRNSLTVGFIGVVRYKEQLKTLIKCIQNSNFDVKIAGDGKDLDDILNYSKGLNKVTIEGRFSSDETLDKYKDVDIIYCVYDNSNENVKLALPNKLAYSILLEKPMIVSKGTYLETKVLEYGVGYSADCTDSKDVLDKLNLIAENINNIDFRESHRKFVEKIDLQRNIILDIL
ncbi:glycosyltransferase family 4 protein [Clostridium perfringens]